MHESQYPIVAARRQGYDSLLWQVPALGVAAQSFLVSAALGKDASQALSAGLLLAASVIGVAVAWLFQKIRKHEVADSRLLQEYEAARSEEGFSIAHGQRVPGFSAYRLWLGLLIASILSEAVAALAIMSFSN
jgi:hypothetical protein